LIYFTSDCHLFHPRIIEYEPFTRHFGSVIEMNEVIISNWNSVVKPEDEVYVLGDFIMGDIKNVASTLARLNGKITLVRGNHDTPSKLQEYRRLGIEVKDIVYKHIHYPLFDDVEVEVHPAPGVLCAPIEDYKLQSFFEVCAKEQFGHKIELPEGAGCIKAPTDEFNRLYLLLHIYCHLFYEGIGLRQVLDYFYVLRRPATMDSKARTVDMFRNLKMLRFARAMMWVQREVFGLEEHRFLVPADKGLGEFLLHEIMLSGNFGHYDVRIDRKHQQRLLTRVWFRFVRSLKFYKMCGAEIRWAIPFKLWHYFWRKQYNQ
jgi:hypothetical protein